MPAAAPSGRSHCRHVTAGAWPRGPGWYVRMSILLQARSYTGPGMRSGELVRSRRSGSTATGEAGPESLTSPTGERGSAGLGQTSSEVVKDEVGDPSAEDLAGLVVEPGVLAGEDAAEPGLVRGGLETAERPGDVAQGYGQVLVLAVESGEHGGRGLADGAVGSRVGRVSRGNRERVPVRVPHDAGIAGGVAQLDRGDRPPDQVVILGVIQADGGVGQGEVEVGEHGGRLLQTAMPGHGEILRDLVPGVPDGRRGPELRRRRLVDGAGRADVLAQALDLVQRLGVGGAGDRRGRRGTELPAAAEHEWSDR